MVQIKSFSLLSLASGALASTIAVSVGSGGNVFSPSSISAQVGDVVEFTFSGEHSVSQSAFDSPCSASGSDVINSGIIGSGVFSVKVNSTDPIYFFCAFGRHCQQGMTGAINAPTSGNTLDAYTSASKSTSGSSAPQGVQNGILGDASLFGASSGSSSASAAASSGTTAAVSTEGNSQSTAAASASAASSTLATAATGSATIAGSSATSSSAADKVKALGVAGFAGLFAALLA